jgi:ABC-type nitrate/sulfonate/bicarbonate transport system ATPase subunit
MSLGESSLKPMNRAVYLFGNSGCGKSTFANYSAGRELVVIKKKI